LDESLQLVGQRQEFYFGRLRQFAAQMESASYPSDPQHLAEVKAMESAGLLRSIESMNYEMQSLVERLRGELRVAERVVAEAETTDPETCLMNRQEIERRIAERRASGKPHALLLFTLAKDAAPEVLRQVALRLTQQVRYNDRVARWGEREFLVLFAGPPDIAEIRITQIVPWIAGRYLLDNGDHADVDVEAHILSVAAISA
jgi:GGDEF domain-containing protein